MYRLAWLVAAVISLVGGILMVLWLAGEDAASARARAVAELDAGQVAPARSAFRRLERAGPLEPADRLLGARIASAASDFDRALELLAGVGDDDPLRAEADALAGRIEIGRDRLRMAEQHLLRALEFDPDLIQPRRELILIYGYQSRFAALAAQFLALAGRAPFNHRDLLLWSHRDAMVWEGREVIEFLGRAVEADPDDHWSRIALADALRTANRTGEAAEMLAPVPASHPGAAAARARLAQELGDLKEVERILAEAPEDDPSLAYMRGVLAAGRGDLAAAERFFRAAIQVDPNDRSAIQGLVQASRQQGNQAEADRWSRKLEALTTAHTLLGQTSPTTPPPVPRLLAIAEALEAADRAEEARAWYGEVLRRDPLNDPARLALFRLDRAASP